MLTLARDDAPEGFWLRAERQTAGRGRLGRYWESESGNLFCSGLVRLRKDDPQPATLALVAGIATYEIVRPFLSEPEPLMIKWPNDLLYGGAKLSGILLERAGNAIVVGIGVNVTGHPRDMNRPATSLWSLGGTAANAETLMATLADHFVHWLAVWRTTGVIGMRDHWLRRAHPVGTALRTSLPDGSSIAGAFAGLNEQGALILRLANGDSHAIHAGDVFLTDNA